MSERNEDPFAFEEEDDSRKTAAELERERNRLGKKLREAQAEIERLKPFEASVAAAQRENRLTELFKSAGVDPKRVKYYTALNPDVDASSITKEQIQAFARDEGFEVEELQSETDTDVQIGKTEDGFEPVSAAQTTSPKTGMMTRKDWLELAGKGPEGAKAAEAAFLAGKVDLSEVYEGVGPNK